MHTHAIYQPGQIHCQTTCYPSTEGLRAAYTGEHVFDAKRATPDKLASDYLAEKNASLAAGEVPFQLMELDEACRLIREQEDARLVSPWTEITEERWWDALECLPPCKWRTVNGVEIFYISEAYTSDIHTHCAKHGEKYYERQCRTSTPYEQLSQEVLELAAA